MSSAPVKKWFVNEEGDITDGDVLIAEPNYLMSVSYKTAHLLAAAPELLAALEEVAAHFRYVESYLPHKSEMSKNVLAAIKKAKGL